MSSHIELMKFLVSTFLCNISSINLFTCRCWYILLFGPITVDINLIWVIELIKQYKYVLIKTSILEKEQSLSRTEQFYERSCVCFQVFLALFSFFTFLESLLPEAVFSSSTVPFYGFISVY